MGRAGRPWASLLGVAARHMGTWDNRPAGQGAAPDRRGHRPPTVTRPPGRSGTVGRWARRLPWPEPARSPSIAPMTPELVFVLEQALGHRAYTAQLERAVATRRGVSSTVVRVEPDHSGPLASMPGLGNHSLQASLQAWAALRRRARHHRIDALLFHTQSASLLAGHLMRRVPTVISLDATPVNYDRLGAGYGHRRHGRVAEAAKLRVYRTAFESAASLVAWSHWVAASLVGDYGIAAEKIRVIRPGVDLTRFRPGAQRDHERVRVLFVGGDFRRKGGDDLLQAMASLGDRAECDVVTDTPGIRVPAGARVRVHQGVSPASPEVLRLYRSADIFALPTRAECYGQVIVEAMASALPVVTCRGGAMTELVTDGVNGLFVPAASPTAVAAALATLVESPDLRRRMGRRGLETARTEHDAERNLDLLVETMLRVSNLDAGPRAGSPPA